MVGNNNKNAFWQALLATLVIFLLGITIGFLFELSRNTQVENTLYLSEVSLLDQQTQSQIVNTFVSTCNDSKTSLFESADTIYADANLLEQYDSTSKFQNTLTILHKRYDLLRLLVLAQSMELKNRCNLPFHTIVYLYSYGTDSLETKAEESTVSQILTDMKDKHGDDLLLLPIAANLNLSSVNVLLKSYNITQLPALIIDENRTMTYPFSTSNVEQNVFRNTEN